MVAFVDNTMSCLSGRFSLPRLVKHIPSLVDTGSDFSLFFFGEVNHFLTGGAATTFVFRTALAALNK